MGSGGRSGAVVASACMPGFSLEKANRPEASAGQPRRGGGPKTANRAIDEDRIVEIPGLPPGSVFRGYEDYFVQELVFAQARRALSRPTGNLSALLQFQYLSALRTDMKFSLSSDSN
jgi:hypothetical protein